MPYLQLTMNMFHICQVLLYSLCNRYGVVRANGENRDIETNVGGVRRGRLLFDEWFHLHDSHWQIEYRIRAAGAAL